VYNGSAWVDVAPRTAIFNETQTAGTNGGTSVTGSFLKRTLNTTVVNNITGCSIASSVITLPAGSYYVSARTPVNQSDQARAKIRNTTDGVDLALSGSHYLPPTISATIYIVIEGYFELTASKTIELQYRVATACASNGLGINTNLGVSEIYSSITIMKVA
jgi:hypothetical protein